MSLNSTEITSKEKIIVLNEKLSASWRQTNPESRDDRFTSKLVNYGDTLRNLEQLFLNEEINLDTTKAQSSLNRGDRGKQRFENANKEEIMEDQISRLTKQMIEEIEDEGLCDEFIEACKHNGVYEILYHNPVIGEFSFVYLNKGRQLTGLFILEFSKKVLMFCAASIVFYSTVAILGLGGAWMVAGLSLLTTAMTYMGGLLYGIINDIFATNANLTYFLLGHGCTQKSFFKTNDPKALAIGWGIVGTHGLGLIAALIFGITTALVTTFSSSHILVFALPILIASLPIITLFANIFATWRINKLIDNGLDLPNENRENITEIFNLDENASCIDLEKVDLGSLEIKNFLIENKVFNEYQLKGLDLMTTSKNQRANWLGNGDRNLFGYLVIPLVAIIDITLMLSLQSAPEYLYGTLFSVTIPIATALLTLGFLVAAQTYLTSNQDKQLDNRFKLSPYDRYDIDLDRLYVTQEHISPSNS